MSEKTKIAIAYDDSLPAPISAPNHQKPLIDWVPGKGNRIWIHPYVAMPYAMSVPEFQADVNIWVVDLMMLGTVNPHVLEWTREEYERGLEFSHDEIDDLYGKKGKRRE